MEEFDMPLKNNDVVLALGAESAGNFSLFQNGKIYFSQDFGDLLDDANYCKFEKELYQLLRKEKIKPTIVLSDLHPLFKTTELAQKLAKKYGAQYFPIQHHIAHIFSTIGDRMIHDTFCLILF